ncbi:MAG: hypothetical protein AAFR44_08545, partial [Pseudomonadota bacterium]
GRLWLNGHPMATWRRLLRQIERGTNRNRRLKEGPHRFGTELCGAALDVGQHRKTFTNHDIRGSAVNV